MTDTSFTLLETLEGVYTGRVRPVQAYRHIAPQLAADAGTVRLSPEDARLAATACRALDAHPWTTRDIDRLLEIAQAIEDQL